MKEARTHAQLLTNVRESRLAATPFLASVLAWSDEGQLGALAGFCFQERDGKLGKELGKELGEEVEPGGGPGAWKKFGPAGSC